MWRLFWLHIIWKKQYIQIIKPEGHIEFKTDNEGLFEFTLEQIEEAELKILEMSRDLHNSPYAEKNIPTEYEDKFSQKGKNINYVSMKAWYGISIQAFPVLY